MTTYLDRLFSLEGRRALVTGGSSGIGLAIAEALAGAGAAVTIAARRPGPLDDAVERIRAAGGEADRIEADLGVRAEAHALADAVLDRYGVPDVLVHAAGVNVRRPMDELTEDEWDRSMRVNLDAAFVLGQRFGPLMAERGSGRIVHLSSQQAERAFGSSGAYGVSKAAIGGLTRSQAEAWSPHGVTVNALAPGFVQTPLNEVVWRDPERSAAMAARTFIGRNGVPGDLAGIAVFLASDASAFMTGQTVFVDGGFSVH